MIWESVLDGCHEVTVERTRPGRGILKVNGTVVKAVLIHYDARFGPDAQDVEDWMQAAINFVDANPAEDSGT